MLSYYIMIWRSKSSNIDESLDVFACHGIGGTWGAIATGIFATVAVNSAGADGLIYGNGMKILKQLVGVATTWVYAFGVTEKRRVGKECRSRWSPYHDEKMVGLE